MSNGQKLLEAITNCTLFMVECQECGTTDGHLIVWSSGAAEQLDGILEEINNGALYE